MNKITLFPLKKEPDRGEEVLGRKWLHTSCLFLLPCSPSRMIHWPQQEGCWSRRCIHHFLKDLRLRLITETNKYVNLFPLSILKDPRQQQQRQAFPVGLQGQKLMNDSRKEQMWAIPISKEKGGLLNNQKKIKLESSITLYTKANSRCSRDLHTCKNP